MSNYYEHRLRIIEELLFACKRNPELFGSSKQKLEDERDEILSALAGETI